jgi:hypothetical protein
MKTGGFVIQVGGGGKGCGKTALICKLLELFPGTPTFKSGTHHFSDETEADTRLFLAAGASEAAYFSESEESDLICRLDNARTFNTLIFLEKNRRIPSYPPDYYIFIDRSVHDPRDDRRELQETADFTVCGSTIPEILISTIHRHLSARKNAESH